MEMIDTRIYDDFFLLAKIFEYAKLNQDEKERLYKHFERQKKGKWISHTLQNGEKSINKDVCSECGERFYQIAETGCKWNFCPHCGADMRGGEHDFCEGCRYNGLSPFDDETGSAIPCISCGDGSKFEEVMLNE